MSQHPANQVVKRSRASLIILIVLAFLLMSAAVVLVYNLPDDDAWRLKEDPAESTSAAEIGFDCEPIEAQRLFPFHNGLYKLTGSRIARLDNQGDELFAVDVDFTAPFSVQSDQLFFAADRDGHSFVMLDQNGERYRGSVEGRISGASINQQGYLAIIQDQTNSTGVVTIFAPGTGEKLFDCFFPESGYVLSVDFSPGGDVFDVSLLNTASSTAAPIIKRYDLSGRALAQRLPDLNELFPLILHDDDEHFVLAGASQIVALTYDTDEIRWQQSFYQIQSVISGDQAIYTVAAAEIDGPYSLYRIDSNGNTDELAYIGEASVQVRRISSLVAVAGGNRVLVIDGRTGILIFEQQMTAEVIRLGFVDERALLVVTRTGVRRLELGLTD